MLKEHEFMFDPIQLKKLARQHREDYPQMKPFPHVVIDNLLPEEVLRDVLEEFPRYNQINWDNYEGAGEKKLATSVEAQMGTTTRLLLYHFNSSHFIRFLEELTGVEGLIPDPYLLGGGLHQIRRGGFLKVHADFNRHPTLRLDRRLNLLLYLNEDWKEEYGGHLELWNRDMTRCEEKILPIVNRCVIFSTTDFSFHGHPDVLTCPEAKTRNSIALYYYSNGRPEEEVSSTHSTLWQQRPGEFDQMGWTPNIHPPTRTLRIKHLLKRFIPPIVIDARDYMSSHFRQKDLP
jgi:Rps23 Pro-64 3,4-dihydroxylase Tpa1-like proline 4-hydroxylase